MGVIFLVEDSCDRAQAREPFGRAVAEAMATGKPVVALNSAGPAELIEHGVSGLRVPPANDALAAAVVQVLRDPAFARRLGQAARHRILERFRLDQMAAAVEQVYEELLIT